VEDPAANPVTVEMKARVRRTEKLRKDFDRAAGRSGAPPAEVAVWLEPDRLVPLDGRIRELAAEVTEGKETDLEKARAIYDYVVDTMSYDKSGEGWGHGDIYWACDMKRGNCTDFHALFTGLNRAVGIPAKFAIGLPVPEDRGEGEIGGYHCWAEFWLDGYGWVPVDTSEARKTPAKREYFFGAHDENRVELSEGRDIVLAPEQSGEPLNFFVYPYVEVDGEPWEKVSQTFSYRDVPSSTGSGQPGS
jgi:transglutaminase-like putative cysteine protease